MNEEILDPSGAVVRFLEKLPSTDGYSLPGLVLYYAGLRISKDLEDLVPDIRQYLEDADHYNVKVGRVLSIIAYIDQILWVWLDRIPKNRSAIQMMAAKQPDNPLWEHIRISAPLKDKHTEQTHARWRELREGILSPEAIRTYEEQMYRDGK